MSDELRKLLQDTVNEGLYRIIISNARDKEQGFKVKIRPVMLKQELCFQETLYKGTQVFHGNYKETEQIERITKYLQRDFKQCEIEHTKEKAVVLVSKKGAVKVKRRVVKSADEINFAHNRTKRYLLEEGIPVPFLIDLGVQNADGQIMRSKYDKFRQINRFLEFIDDILPALEKRMQKNQAKQSQIQQNRQSALQIVDFGCGKSYLTFAVYYFLHELKKMDVSIIGLDLKADVIRKCQQLSEKYGYEKLHFYKGDIAEYEELTQADMVITLHACDTATDYALQKAVCWNAEVILSVPCCQHEVNKQILSEALEPILKYGIIKERISALITDALRADLLYSAGYETALLEFIDMEHTPKNLLIRAVKKDNLSLEKRDLRRRKAEKLMKSLQIDPTLHKLLQLEDIG